MEKPSLPNSPPKTLIDENSSETKTKKKFPTPQELISHYQTRGLDSNEASIKVIEDLQNALVRVVSSSRNSTTKKEKLVADAARKVDAVNGRLAVLDMKVDSKPGFVETFAIGLASGAAVNGIGAVWPHVLRGLGQVWNAVWSVTDSSSSSASPP